MLSSCLVCGQNTENKDLKVLKTRNNRLILSTRCPVCNDKKSKFIKEQEARGLSDLGIKTPLSKFLC